MPKPSLDDLRDDNFFNYVKNGQKYNTSSGARSTASINGGQTYAATTHTVADILQGNLNQVNPQDQLLVLNKALTDTLGSLYNSPDAAHGFSTFTNTAPSFSPGSSGGGGGGGALGSGGIGATMEETTVQQLPLKHPQGGLIWAGRGRASEEMHIPAGGTIQEDVANHLQYEDLPTNKKHPYYMDRNDGDGAGGVAASVGADGYVVNWGGGDNILSGSNSGRTIGNENPDKPGTSGAFGLLTAEEEQFYCSMAWPYRGGPPESFRRAGREDIALIAEGLKKDEHYKGKKVLVWSFETKRAVVCTPGDWGTQPYWSNGAVSSGSINGFYIGLSPDVHHALGTKHGTEVLIRWMPDDTPLGPYGSVSGSDTGGLGEGIASAISAVQNYSVEVLKYAGNIVASHPNLIGDSFKDHLRNGFAPQVAGHSIAVFKQEINRGFHFPALLNYLWFIMEAGFSLRVDGIAYVHRNTQGGRLSNHATGGAIDIMAIGRGTPVTYTNAKWRAENDAMWSALANLPRATKPSESASSFASNYGPDSWYKVYQDPNPTHVHLGFSTSQIGTFISALSPASSSPAGITRGAS